MTHYVVVTKEVIEKEVTRILYAPNEEVAMDMADAQARAEYQHWEAPDLMDLQVISVEEQ